MKKIKRQGTIALTILAMAAWFAFMLVGFSTPPVNGALIDCPNGPLHADLTGTDVNGKTPSGMAMFREKGSNGLMVMVRNVDTTAGTSLTVMIGTTNVGTIDVTKNGEGQLKLESAAGVADGTAITVMNGTTTALSGTFACTAKGGGNSNMNSNTGSNSNTNTNSNMNMSPTATPTI